MKCGTIPVARETWDHQRNFRWAEPFNRSQLSPTSWANIPFTAIISLKFYLNFISKLIWCDAISRWITHHVTCPSRNSSLCASFYRLMRRCSMFFLKRKEKHFPFKRIDFDRYSTIAVSTSRRKFHRIGLLFANLQRTKPIKFEEKRESANAATLLVPVHHPSGRVITQLSQFKSICIKCRLHLHKLILTIFFPKKNNKSNGLT